MIWSLTEYSISFTRLIMKTSIQFALLIASTLTYSTQVVTIASLSFGIRGHSRIANLLLVNSLVISRASPV